MERVVYLGGLPRSCSTVLSAVLNQNPDFFVSPTSPMLGLVSAMRRCRTNDSTFRALNKDEVDVRMLNAVRGTIRGWYAPNREKVCFDKSRAAVGLYNILNRCMPDLKIIVPVRDLRGVVTSFEKKNRESVTMDVFDPADPLDGVTVQSRVERLLAKAPLGPVLETLFEATQRGFINNMLVVRAEDFGRDPAREVDRIYQYLGLSDLWFPHRYDEIGEEPREHDHVHAPYGSHRVSDRVAPPPEDWDEILGPALADSIVERCRWFYEAFYPERCSNEYAD